MLKSPVSHTDLPSSSGMSQLDTILDIVKNETVYKKRLADLKKKRDELVKLISAVGSVNTINEIREQVEQEKLKLTAERSAGYDLLNNKKEAADLILSEAHTRARTIEADAANRSQDQKNVLDLREKELNENRKQLNEREKEFSKNEEKLRVSKLSIDAELERLEQFKEMANKARIDYEYRKQQLEAAIAGV